jgi:hypothetical protein
VASLERAFATYKNTDIPVMVEWRDDFRSEESFRRFEYRLDYLVTILQKMAGLAASGGKIHLLPCLGWAIASPRFERIGLVFDVIYRQNAPSPPPPLLGTPPVASLHQLITRIRHDTSAIPPPLGNRFVLATHSPSARAACTAGAGCTRSSVAVTSCSPPSMTGSPAPSSLA